jgi:hypothetical protein
MLIFTPGNTAYISGSTVATFNKGVAVFDQLSATCYPGGSMTIEYTVSVSGFGLAYQIKTEQDVQFRLCRDGEILSSNQCFECKNGTYSLHYSDTATVRRTR